MLGVVVAVALLACWYVVRGALVMAGLDAARDPHIASLSFTVIVGAHLVIAGSVTELARRLSGSRKAAAAFAAFVHLAIALTLAVAVGLLYRPLDAASVQAWLVAMYAFGWKALDVAAVLGLAVAAGRRGAWLAPPAIGAAMLQPINPFSVTSWNLVFSLALMVFTAALAVAVERRAGQPEPARERAIAGVRRCQHLAIVGALLAVATMFERVTGTFSVYFSLPLGSIGIAFDLAFVAAAWSIAQARLPNLPRWPWALAVTATVWAVVRWARVWFLTITRYWGHLGDAKLVVAHWTSHVPAVLATVAGLVGLVLFGRRSGARDLTVSALAILVFRLVVFAVRIAVPDELVLAAGCSVLFNLAAARVYRSAALELEGGLPRARIQDRTR